VISIAASVIVLVHAGWRNGSPNSFDVAVVTGDVFGLVEQEDFPQVYQLSRKLME